MKRCMFLVLTALLLSSCVGIPPAENKSDTLVIGSFIVDFPDGFFREEPKTITSGITLTFKNLTQGSSFMISTSEKGYFWFLSNGKDSYELDSYHYNYESGSRWRYQLDSKIGYEFTTMPERVLYLGHLTLIYRQPQKPDPTAYGRGPVPWNFQTSFDAAFRTEELRDHLKKIDMRSVWVSHEIVTQKEVTAEQVASPIDARPAVTKRAAPAAVVVDSDGNLYFSDSRNNLVRKIGVNGKASTVAGSGTAGYKGDGGAATSAQLSFPRSLAVDGSGNLFIADVYNNRVRKVSTDGTITTVAGSGRRGSGNETSLGDGGLATEATLSSPGGIALDAAGNLYIADTNNHRVRKVDDGGIITTVAGNGIAGFTGDGGAAVLAALNFPMGLAIDAEGSLYIADKNNRRIRKVDLNGSIMTIAGGGDVQGNEGPAKSARLVLPFSLALDGAGNLYIADFEDRRVRKVDSTGRISTIPGTASGGGFELGGLSGIVVDSDGTLYIADPFKETILKIDSSGTVTRVDLE